MADQELTLRGKGEGFEGVAKQVDKVTEAQDRAKDSTQEGTQAQEKASASTENFIATLREVHPLLGVFAESMIRATKISGDLAGKQINLKAIGESLTKTIQSNSESLLALGAGGAVAAAVSGIVAVMSKLAEETERATNAIKEQSEALNELQSQRRSLQADLESLSDARRGGGFTAEGSANAEKAFNVIRGEVPEDALSDADLKEAIAALFGRGFSGTDILKAAFFKRRGLDLDPSERADRLHVQLDSFARENEEEFNRFLGREIAQKGKRFRSAINERTGVGGPSLNLTDEVRRILGPGSSEEHVRNITAFVQQFGTESGLNAAIERGNQFNFGAIAAIQQQLDGARFVGPDGPGLLGALGVTDRITSQDLAELRNVLRQLSLQLDRENREPRVLIDNRNSRQVVPGAEYRARTEKNSVANIRARIENR